MSDTKFAALRDSQEKPNGEGLHMTQFKHVLSIAIILLATSTSAFSGGIYLSEIGTPLSVGTAGVAGVTNTIGADSVFTNPAGMTLLDGDQVTGGVQLLIPTNRFDSDIATAGGSDGGNAGSPVAIPSLFAVKHLNDDWSVGFGISAPMGGGVDYGKDFVGRYQTQVSELAVISISPAAAYKVNEKLSLGAGVSFLYTDLNLHMAVKQPGPFASDGQARMDGLDDWGYQGYLGATYKANNRLTFGAVYRSEADVELEGDLNFRGITVPPLNKLTSQLNKAKVDFTYPQMVNVGFKYQIADDLMLMADVDWEDWSEFGDTRIGLSGDASTLQSFDRDWDDTWHLGFALAKKFAEKQAVTAGISYDSSPVSDSKRTADLPVDEQIRFSAAYGKEMSDQINFALGGTFVLMGEGKMDQTAQGERFKGEFSTNHLLFLSASLKYLF
jgi:long-chain fatty acid transport protein